MKEHSAIPGEDVFLPHTDCHDVYIIECLGPPKGHDFQGNQ